MAKAAYEFSEDTAFEEAARIVMLAAFHKMMKNVAATRSGLEQCDPTPAEIEALHDMRVGSRRLRAALSIFGGLFSKHDYREFNRQLGDITDALGTVRDLDVQIATLRRLAVALPEAEAYGIARLIARQTKRRNNERKLLIAALERFEHEKFARHFQKALDKAAPITTGTQEEARGEKHSDL